MRLRSTVRGCATLMLAAVPLISPRVVRADALLSVQSCGAGGPDLAAGFGPDETPIGHVESVDLNISHIEPCAAEFLTRGSTTGGSDWLLTGLEKANFGPSQGWNFHYAPEVTSVNLIINFNIVDYYAWVISMPDVTAPDGRTRLGRIHDVDAGGAVFLLSYIQLEPTDPTPTYCQVEGVVTYPCLHWVQAFRQSLKGEPFEIKLDVQTGAQSPFYDVGGTVGNYMGGRGAYFQDRPFDCESRVSCSAEGEEDYHTSVEFNVFLAVENAPQDVTLYAGYHWGYVYTTADIVTPEPSSISMVFIGVALIGLNQVRSRSKGGQRLALLGTGGLGLIGYLWRHR